MDIREAKRILSTTNINHLCNTIDDVICALDTLELDAEAFYDLVTVEWAAAISRLDFYTEDVMPSLHSYCSEAVADLPNFKEKLEESYKSDF
jgi:hypothetical protein